MKTIIIFTTIACIGVAKFSEGAMQQVFGVLSVVGIVLCFSFLHEMLTSKERRDFK